MGPHETEMRRQVAEGWIPDADYRVFQGGTFARDYCAEITAERDTIRAELAAARQHAEYQDKEIRQWASVCYVGTWPLSEEDTKNTGFYGRLAAKMTAERDAATARAEKAEAKLDWLIMKCHWTSEQIHIGPYAAIDEAMRKEGKDG